jgi:hypothetical protein
MSRSEVAVPVATKLFLELAEFLQSKGSDRDPVDAVSSAIEYWMRSFGQGGDTEPLQQQTALDSSIPVTTEGYWWKKVFIPDGSKARMSYKGKVYFAEISPSGFLFEGKVRSPSEFTWSITKTARNAWRDIEFKFPSSEKWILADQLRRQAEIDALI